MSNPCPDDRPATPAVPAEEASRFPFQGLQQEADSGLCLLFWREFNPTPGRWMEQDPVRFEGGPGL
jgi:RHS repeat-associated protein